MSCVRLEENFNLQLKKIYKKDGSRYELQLCCPVIVNLENDCPRDMVAIKVPHCFVSNGVVYEVDSPSKTPIEVEYTNQTLCKSEDPAICIKNDNCWFIFIETDKVLKVNDLCITKFDIPVTPSCLDSEKITSPVPIEDVITFEYYDDADFEALANSLDSISNLVVYDTVNTADDPTELKKYILDKLDNSLVKNQITFESALDQLIDPVTAGAVSSEPDWIHPAYPHLLLAKLSEIN